MSSTSFILGSTNASLPSSETLNLLPFSLGPSSNPYKSSVSSLSSFFHPRRVHANSASPTGNANGIAGPSTLTAAFRGRALVGQQVQVPRGYRGVILSTTSRPDSGGFEERREAKSTQADASPTPSSSIETRQTRQKGTGQTALAKPKTRQAPRRAVKKRMRLDSDEEEDEDGVKQETAPGPTTPRKGLTRTLSKRPRGDVPAITVQEPTPRKPLRRDATDTSIETDVGRGDGAVAEEVDMGFVSAVLDIQADDAEGSEAAEVTSAAEVSGAVVASGLGVTEDIVPSPATEDDPPSFDMSRRTSSAPVIKIEAPADPHENTADNDERSAASSAVDSDTIHPQHSQNAKIVPSPQTTIERDGAIRLLRPTATFAEITLWTPDAPLAGFRPDETPSGAGKTGETDQPAIHATREQPDVEETNEQTDSVSAQVKKGWWRVGGAGEGGDEFVRAMGEWIGLVEMIHEPVYLLGLSDDDEDDDE